MIFYLHIPKTGGLTLGLRLASAFLPEETHTLKNGLHYPKDLETFRLLTKTKKFVESHIDGRMLGEFSDLDIMVTVRDPVEQILSYWRNILREPKEQLHRAANKLHHRVFFGNFGDYFTDLQSRYFIGAFLGIGMEIQRFGHYTSVAKRLVEFVERVRWLVPTESLDEFISLWSLETKRWVPNATQRVNVSENSADNKGDALGEVREYLRRRTELYAVDSLFHHMARERFDTYRTNIFRSQGIERYADNSRRAFVSGDSAIWLSDNWYDPVSVEGGQAWWAGPTKKSVIHVRRANNERYLTFDVIVISGVQYERIIVCDNDTLKPLPTRRVERDSNCSFCVTLDRLGREDDMVVLVPVSKAAIMTTPNSDGLERQSFAATNWSLRNDAIG